MNRIAQRQLLWNGWKSFSCTRNRPKSNLIGHGVSRLKPITRDFYGSTRYLAKILDTQTPSRLESLSTTTMNGAVAISQIKRNPRRSRMRSPAVTPNPDSQRVAVSAIHLAQTIDFASLPMECEHRLCGKNFVVYRLTGGERYVALFRFGSVVFFNVDAQDATAMIDHIKSYATDPDPTGFERKEYFEVLVSELHHQDAISELDLVTGDYCMVQELDMNGVAVIANIMAQTVALDKYADTVDDLLTNFAKINSHVTKSGSFNGNDKSDLFKTVAQNNAIFIDMISKIRIYDRSDIAWNLTKYETIHYGLKEEFEIDDRFENIEFKLNLIQQNAKFFLEVLHHQKSNNLEWIIAILILLECILMCIEMSGLGEAVLPDMLQSAFGGIFGFMPSCDLTDTLTPNTDTLSGCEESASDNPNLESVSKR